MVNKEYVLYGPRILLEEYIADTYHLYDVTFPNNTYFNEDYIQWIKEQEPLLLKVYADVWKGFYIYFFTTESDILLFKIKYPEIDWNLLSTIYHTIIRY